MLTDMEWFFENLESGTPFAFARFNDGEMMGIVQVGSVVARGDQYVNESLSISLKDALIHRQKNYYVGIPCSLCYPTLNDVARSLVGDYEHLTSAVITTNKNWKNFMNRFPSAIKGKRLVWVGGNDQNVDNLKELGIEVDQKGLIPNKNSWKFYEHVRNTFPQSFQAGDVVAISLGPSARVLVKEWFKERPDVTFIDVGSNFDPYTRNVWHNCHKGWEETGFNQTAPCEECN
tara:strand:- start:15676 stop:16371 length:696 start_codon:yes stop_codon:yes gene_type:complete